MLVHSVLGTGGKLRVKHGWPHSDPAAEAGTGSPACRSCTFCRHWEMVLCKPSKVRRLSYSLCRVGWSEREAEGHLQA